MLKPAVFIVCPVTRSTLPKRLTYTFETTKMAHKLLKPEIRR